MESDHFYDELAPFYDLILSDWESSMKRQAKILDGNIVSAWGKDAKSIVDVSCGIGTQAIGLADRGYRVTASDLSAKAVERAREETRKRGLEISYSVANMLEVSSHYSTTFDVLISCDNSVPHLLTDREIEEAFVEFYRCLNPGGGCLITMRDYEKEGRLNLQILPYRVRDRKGKRFIPFQIREYSGDRYELSLYLVIDEGTKKPETKVFRTRYYAVPLSKVIQLMRKAGFTKVKQVESDFYQPVIIGTKKG